MLTSRSSQPVRRAPARKRQTIRATRRMAPPYCRASRVGDSEAPRFTEIVRPKARSMASMAMPRTAVTMMTEAT